MTECNKSVYLANKSIDMIDAINKGYTEGYNKAIDDFAGGLDYLLEKYAIENTLEPNIENVKVSLNYIKKITSRIIEQLKAGEENERSI